jgi:hypothetical protein
MEFTREMLKDQLHLLKSFFILLNNLSLATKYRNVFLNLAMDGVNPYGYNVISHSIWPILITNLNFPFWMSIKTTYMILSCIILSKSYVL